MSLLSSNPSEFVRSGLGPDFQHLLEPDGWAFSATSIQTLPSDAILLEKPIPDGALLLARFTRDGEHIYHIERRHPPRFEGSDHALSFLRGDLREDRRLADVFVNAHQQALLTRDGD